MYELVISVQALDMRGLFLWYSLIDLVGKMVHIFPLINNATDILSLMGQGIFEVFAIIYAGQKNAFGLFLLTFYFW